MADSLGFGGGANFFCFFLIAVRRLMCEAQEMACSEERFEIHAEPLADNLFEWHFTFRGPTDTVYSAGIYHGRIILPSNYPMSPPEIAILTVSLV